MRSHRTIDLSEYLSFNDKSHLHGKSGLVFGVRTGSVILSINALDADVLAQLPLNRLMPRFCLFAFDHFAGSPNSDSLLLQLSESACFLTARPRERFEGPGAAADLAVFVIALNGGRGAVFPTSPFTQALCQRRACPLLALGSVQAAGPDRCLAFVAGQIGPFRI